MTNTNPYQDANQAYVEKMQRKAIKSLSDLYAINDFQQDPLIGDMDITLNSIVILLKHRPSCESPITLNLNKLTVKAKTGKRKVHAGNKEIELLT